MADFKLKKAVILSVLLFLINIMFSCGTKSEETIIVAGSTSVQPYAEILAEEYKHLHPGKEIDIQGGGSSAGIFAAASKTAEIGMSSRFLKDSESESFEDPDQEWYIVEIAKDGLAVIIHPDNPIQDLGLDQINSIYAAKITNWKNMGGNDAKIHVITREEGSGTRSAFEELVMGGDYITPKAIVQDSNGSVRLLVSDDVNAIGFISLGLVKSEKGQKPVKALSLDGITATEENIKNGSYKLFRPFLFVAAVKKGEGPEGLAKDFIDFTVSPEGRRILISEGLIPSADTAVIIKEGAAKP